MKTKLLTLCVILSGLLAGVTNAANLMSGGGVTIGVYGATGPDAFTSPSYSGWAANAMGWLQNTSLPFGNPALSPTAYTHAASVIQAGDITSSSFPAPIFNSWRGTANPSAPFAGEYGNMLHFGLRIVANPGTTFLLSDLSYGMTSSDGNALGIAGSFSPASTFTSTRVGFDGTTTYTSGSSAGINLVALYYLGIANAYNGAGPGVPQQLLDNVEAYVGGQPSGQVVVNGTYTLSKTSTSSSPFGVTDTITVVPEPSALLLSFLGALVLMRHRRV